MYRVILVVEGESHVFYVQKRVWSFLRMLNFKDKWQHLNSHGLVLDYDHDWEDAEPARFNDQKSAVEFMEGVMYSKTSEPDYTVVAWSHQPE